MTRISWSTGPISTPTPAEPSVAGKVGPQRHWHRRPGLKIDDLLLKRHQHSSQRYTPLARLISQSDQRHSLTQAVRALLPETLRDTVEVVNFRAPSLVLRVGNASLATRLRYFLPDLTTYLLNLADFQGLKKINLRVVQTRTPATPERPSRNLPAQAARSLAEFADELLQRPDYRQLGATIMRLSEHTAAPTGDPDSARDDQAAESATRPPLPGAETDTSS